jgi:hypothetical protein
MQPAEHFFFGKWPSDKFEFETLQLKHLGIQPRIFHVTLTFANSTLAYTFLISFFSNLTLSILNSKSTSWGLETGLKLLSL